MRLYPHRKDVQSVFIVFVVEDDIRSKFARVYSYSILGMAITTIILQFLVFVCVFVTPNYTRPVYMQIAIGVIIDLALSVLVLLWSLKLIENLPKVETKEEEVVVVDSDVENEKKETKAVPQPTA